jgi:glyoxylase-like metal-dependent hydrolase (beta-lactamase superfamily II)
VVLVDTGLGGVLPTTGKLMSNLEAERVHPEDIDVVILTHGHGDHIGGNLDSEGKPAFPNARYVMWREEWDFWTQEPDLSPLGLDEQRKQFLIDLARNNLLPIQNQIQLVESNTEIVSGIEVTANPGHTPGLMAVSIRSGNSELVCISDLALHPIHLEHPEWIADVDLDQKNVLKSRRSFFSRLAEQGPLVFAFHFPFPGLGHIIEMGESWQWKPIE